MQFLKLRFIGADHGTTVRLNETRDKLLSLALNGLPLARGVGCLLLGPRLALLPKHLEHGMGGEQQLLRRPHGIDQVLKVTFQRRLADVLARHRAAFGEAPVIGVTRALAAACPGRRHGPVAAGAVHEAAQREIIAQIGAIRRDRLASMQPLIDFEEGFIGDQRLMLRGHAIHAPFPHAHVSGIKHLRENLAHLLRMNRAEAVLRKDGVVLQEPLHLGLRLEAVGRESFQSLLDDACERLAGHEHLAAMPGHAVIAIPDGR
ncbi:MAG: hypothetical protein WC026_13520 [Hyphomicrobium sp.]